MATPAKHEACRKERAARMSGASRSEQLRPPLGWSSPSICSRRTCSYAFANKGTTPGRSRGGSGTGRSPALQSTRRWRRTASRISGGIEGAGRIESPKGVGKAAASISLDHLVGGGEQRFRVRW